MSRRIKPLLVDEYLWMVDYAQQIHNEKGEPIPSFQETKLNELESCLETPFGGFGGILFYKGLVHKAAMLFYLLARNHVLTNGNKRMACLCLDYFCFKNGYELNIPENEFYNIAKLTVIMPEEQKEITLKNIRKILRICLRKR